MKEKLCQYCGKANKPLSIHCKYCGNRINIIGKGREEQNAEYAKDVARGFGSSVISILKLIIGIILVLGVIWGGLKIKQYADHRYQPEEIQNKQNWFNPL